MAIAPNTTFVAGNVYTAAQANAFGFGIVALTSATAGTTATSEVVFITSTPFTAIANRYYKITFYCPDMKSSTSNTYLEIAIRKGTTTAGTQLAKSEILVGANTGQFASGVCMSITTLTAGSQQVVGTIFSASGTGSFGATATQPAFIIVEDIGPA